MGECDHDFRERMEDIFLNGNTDMISGLKCTRGCGAVANAYYNWDGYYEGDWDAACTSPEGHDWETEGGPEEKGDDVAYYDYCRRCRARRFIRFAFQYERVERAADFE